MYWRGKEEFDNMRNIQKDKKNERKRKETRQLKKRRGEERRDGLALGGSVTEED